MGEPDGPMVVVVRCPGVAHAGEGETRRRAGERVEERPWVLRPEVPAEPLGAVHPERNLVVGQRQQLPYRFQNADLIGRPGSASGQN